LSEVVIDAGAAIHLLVAGDVQLADIQALHAPSLMWSELLSALHALTWRGQVPIEAAARIRERVEATPFVRFDDGPFLHQRAWEIADRLGWAKTYDAEYVALAQILDLPLLTVDGRLQRRVEHLIKVIGPADLGA
jgi:predicted nucleic acid-binding protein